VVGTLLAVALVPPHLLTIRQAAHDCVGPAEGAAALPTTAPVAPHGFVAPYGFVSLEAAGGFGLSRGVDHSSAPALPLFTPSSRTESRSEGPKVAVLVGPLQSARLRERSAL